MDEHGTDPEEGSLWTGRPSSVARNHYQELNSRGTECTVFKRLFWVGVDCSNAVPHHAIMLHLQDSSLCVSCF